MDLLPDCLAETLLNSVKNNAASLSDDTIWSIHTTLLETALHLRTAHNARQGLLRLPPEVLSEILEDILDPYCSHWTFRPFWRSTETDSSVLIPVTHTCRRLREVALGLRSLWGTLTTKDPHRVPIFVERSRPAPLTVAAWSRHDIPSVFDVFFTGEANRIQELHLCSVEVEHMNYLYELLNSPLPCLKSFTLHCYQADWYAKPSQLPLSRDRNPSLRYLTLKNTPFLPETGFPTLTHLSLTQVVTGPDLNVKVADLLSDCPRLESVVLSCLSFETVILDGAAHRKPLLLEHLRRVTLHEMDDNALQLYMSLLQPRARDSAYHILGHILGHNNQRDNPLLRDFLFPPETQKRSEDQPAEESLQLCISVHPDHNGEFSGWDRSYALTVTTRECTRRLATYSGQRRYIGNSVWITQLLAANATWLAAIREVWVVNAAPSTFWPRFLSSDTCAPVMSPLVHFPALETLTLVSDHTFLVEGTTQPGLYLLPSTEDPTAVAPKLTALRLMHGFSDHTLAKRRATERHVPLADTLDFKQMLEDLRCGDYAYLRDTRLIVQTTPNVRVDRNNLDRLREHFKDVRHEWLDALPAMPVRGEDPARRGCEKWSESHW
ncbi:hypothetical protein K466DRAFT_660001 [Polyporus arcularius HHB13444]|uniref:Uncharacterized protein n=1 Tax=Polyporus arcularius HHB13444 TaxID=1314778 RepID=A0A5C3PUP4_9APHY|nr:hypothetical protein K466DRAFT_660001 [Polyporus arcularius HHB13444]